MTIYINKKFKSKNAIFNFKLSNAKQQNLHIFVDTYAGYTL